MDSEEEVGRKKLANITYDKLAKAFGDPKPPISIKLRILSMLVPHGSCIIREPGGY